MPCARRSNTGFDKLRRQAHAVLFELGPSQQEDLTLRENIRRLGRQQRLIVLSRIALWKYRLQLPGFEPPESIHQAQREFDNELAETLEGMADRIEGTASRRSEDRGSAATPQGSSTFAAAICLPIIFEFWLALTTCLRMAVSLSLRSSQGLVGQWAHWRRPYAPA